MFQVKEVEQYIISTVEEGAWWECLVFGIFINGKWYESGELKIGKVM